MPDQLPPLAGETLMQYLVRTRPSFEWQDNDGASEPWAIVAADPEGGYPRYTLRAHVTSAEFAAAVSILFPTAPATPTAPVWPGLDKVTLGTPLALADGLTIDGPLDGVLVEVTGHPTSAGKYGFGDLNSWRYLGAVLFITDNGQAEWPIQLGPESGIQTPRSMARASSAILRLNGGFTGTVTPWTINTGA